VRGTFRGEDCTDMEEFARVKLGILRGAARSALRRREERRMFTGAVLDAQPVDTPVGCLEDGIILPAIARISRRTGQLDRLAAGHPPRLSGALAEIQILTMPGRTHWWVCAIRSRTQPGRKP
jgi:hypothetical protein